MPLFPLYNYYINPIDGLKNSKSLGSGIVITFAWFKVQPGEQTFLSLVHCNIPEATKVVE